MNSTLTEVTVAAQQGQASPRTVVAYLKGTPLGDVMEAKGKKLKAPPAEYIATRKVNVAANAELLAALFV
jgi:hypothetical protein